MTIDSSALPKARSLADTRLPVSGPTAPSGAVHPAVGTRLTLLNAFLMGGLSLWLALVTLNNLTDFGTNRALIAKMITMVDLVHDPIRGNGLQWRALDAKWATPMLIGVIVYELVAVALLSRATISLFRQARGGKAPTVTVTRHANLALAAFTGLFFIFLCGGMWYAYWIYIGSAQQVHFTCLIIGLLTVLSVNQVAAHGLSEDR